MKRFWAICLTVLLFITVVPPITIFAAAVDITVIADEGWNATNPGDITYDADTGELKNLVGGYSFACYFSNTTEKAFRLSRFGSGVTATKVVIPSAIVYNGVTYTLKAHSSKQALEAYVMASLNTTSGNNNTTTENKYVTDLVISSGITAIPNQAFRKSYALTNVKLPTGLTDIGNDVFMDCTSITKLDLPSGIKTIGNQLFAGCTSLTSADFPASITSIGTGLFYGANKITGDNITFRFPLTSLNQNIFRNCTGIKSYVVPASVTSVGTKAFEGAGTKTLTFKSLTAPTITDNTAINLTTNLVVHYPENGTGYDESSDFRTKLKASSSSVTFVADAPPPTSCDITNITVKPDRYTVNYSIVLGSGVTNPTCVIALYNDTALAAVQFINPQETTADLLTTAEATKAKIYIWQDVTNIKPLCVFDEISIAQ